MTSVVIDDRCNTDTTPCTIKEAITMQQQQHAKRRRIDIVGVVVKVSFQVVNNDKLVTFVVTDSSKCIVKVILRGNNYALCNVMNGTNRRGDVLRFNDLVLRKDYTNDTTNNAILAEFHSSYCTTTTVSYFKLGSIQRQQQLPLLFDTSTSSSASCSYIIDLVDDNGIPSDMVTSKQLVHDLLARYYEYFSSSSYLLLENNTIGPCKRRRLCEITTHNLISDILVRVHSFHTTINKSSRRKQQYHTTKFAILFDGEQEDDFCTLQLININNNYYLLSSILKNNDTTNNWMLIRQVLSQSSTNDDMRQQHNISSSTNNNIILVTTFGTTITVIENNQEQICNSITDNFNDTIQLNTNDDGCYSFVPPIFHNNDCNNSSSSQYNHIFPNTGTRQFYAKLCNIYFCDFNYLLVVENELVSSSTSDNNKVTIISKSKEFIEAAVTTGGKNTDTNDIPRFRTVNLIIRGSFVTSNDRFCSSSSDRMKLKVLLNDERVIEQLFGDVTAQELLQHDDDARLVVMNMLIALIKEEIFLIWTIHATIDEDCWHVTDIRLPML